MEKISSKSIKTPSITTKTRIKVLNEWGYSWKTSKAPTRVSWFDRLRRHKSKINLRHKKLISGSYYESIFTFDAPLSSNIRDVRSIQSRAQRPHKQYKLIGGTK